MTSALAAKWNSDIAFAAARQISSMSSLYCGPATAGWIASVWNQSKGRQYDLNRIKNKNLFPDGPRLFHGSPPLFERSLDEMIRRETNGELMLSRKVYFKARSIHAAFQQYEMPVVIRVIGNKLKDGLHYVILYRSELVTTNEVDELNFYLQDNGVYGNNHGLWIHKIKRSSYIFPWGARCVVRV